VAVTAEALGCPHGSSRRNIFANGTTAEGWLRGTVVGFDCRVEPGAVVEDSVLFDGVSVGTGAKIHRSILDKRVCVSPGARVGVDPDEDRERGFVVSEEGITCVPKGTVIDS
jgi:glucose-1-phosphate adenylyltransferase